MLLALPSCSDRAARPAAKEETMMLSWAVTFLIIALVAGVLGFGGVAATATGIAKVLFLVFLVLFLLTLVGGLTRRAPVP